MTGPAPGGPGGQTRLAGVVGWPARHSLSPLIHKAWLAATGIDGDYHAFDVEPDGFETFLADARRQGLTGLNVTAPFKERALALADAAEPFAARAGAANLLLFGADGRVEARNLDGLGMLNAMRAVGHEASSGPAVVIGAGGAACGAVAALAGAGAPEIRILNRSRERAEALARSAPRRVRVFAMDQADRALEDAAAIINATTLGMTGQPALELDLSGAPSGAVVLDMPYAASETLFAATARARGHRVADGLSMLIAQARPSFEALFGQAPSAEVDVRALCEARP